MSDFSGFLHKYGDLEKASSCKALFELFGGQTGLGITLRNFQHVYNGEISPSPKVFRAIFGKIKPHHYKNAFLAFTKSLLGSDDENTIKILKFLDIHLSTPIDVEQDDASPALPAPKREVYTEEQLNVLTKNLPIQRLYHKLILRDFLKSEDIRNREAEVAQLVKINLARVEGQEVHCPHIFRKVPNVDDSPTPLVASASDYVTSLINNYLVKTGDSSQELCFTLQMIPKELAEVLKEQTRAFKQWTMTARSDDPENSVPFVHVSFSRVLDWKKDF